MLNYAHTLNRFVCFVSTISQKSVLTILKGKGTQSDKSYRLYYFIMLIKRIYLNITIGIRCYNTKSVFFAGMINKF